MNMDYTKAHRYWRKKKKGVRSGTTNGAKYAGASTRDGLALGLAVYLNCSTIRQARWETNPNWEIRGVVAAWGVKTNSLGTLMGLGKGYGQADIGQRSLRKTLPRRGGLDNNRI